MPTTRYRKKRNTTIDVSKITKFAETERRLTNGEYETSDELSALLKFYTRERLHMLKNLSRKSISYGDIRYFDRTLTVLETVQAEAKRRRYNIETSAQIKTVGDYRGDFENRVPRIDVPAVA